MGRFFEALKAGVKGFRAEAEPCQYSVAGRPVRCPHCGEGKFTPSSALLNTRILSGFNVDWADPSAKILVCAECGHVEWFVNEPEEITGPA